MRMGRWLILVIGILLGGGLATAEANVSGLINVSNDTQLGGFSLQPAISGDGAWVAFTSSSTLLRDDKNGRHDIYVRHLPTGVLNRVSVGYDGSEANSSSGNPHLSGDGRFVAFASEAANLIPGDSNGQSDIFLRDQLTGTTEIVSIGTSGNQVIGSFFLNGISPDGRFVLFTTPHPLNVGDPSPDIDYMRQEGMNIYLRDRQTKTTTYIACGVYPALSSNGRVLVFRRGGSLLLRELQTGAEEVIAQFDFDPLYVGPYNHDSRYIPSISGDGRFVAYEGWSAPGAPLVTEVFVYDRSTRTNTQITRAYDGSPLTTALLYFTQQTPKISTDGRYVLFFSTAADLVQGIAGHQLYLHDLVSQSTMRLPIDNVWFNAAPGQFDINGDGSVVAFMYYSAAYLTEYSALSNIFAFRTGIVSGGGSIGAPKVIAEPPLLWPPNSKLVDVKLTAEVPGASAVEFRIVDEYGTHSQTANGAKATVQLEAWRESQDKDGRTYTVTVIATDDDGNKRLATTEVIVPHEKR